MRSKIWSRRSIQLTSKALIYSHAVRSHSGFISLRSITDCQGIDIDDEPIGILVTEDRTRTHLYRCYNQNVRNEWLTAFKNAKAISSEFTIDEDDDQDDDVDATYKGGMCIIGHFFQIIRIYPNISFLWKIGVFILSLNCYSFEQV